MFAVDAELRVLRHMRLASPERGSILNDLSVHADSERAGIDLVRGRRRKGPGETPFGAFRSGQALGLRRRHVPTFFLKSAPRFAVRLACLARVVLPRERPRR